MSITIGATKPTLTYPNEQEHRTQIVQYAVSLGDVIRTGVVELLHVGSVTLESSQTSTDVSVTDATASSFAFVTPTDANSAGEVASTYAEAQSGNIRIHHPSGVTTRTWNLLVTK